MIEYKALHRSITKAEGFFALNCVGQKRNKLCLNPEESSGFQYNSGQVDRAPFNCDWLLLKDPAGKPAAPSRQMWTMDVDESCLHTPIMRDSLSTLFIGVFFIL